MGKVVPTLAVKRWWCLRSFARPKGLAASFFTKETNSKPVALYGNQFWEGPTIVLSFFFFYRVSDLCNALALTFRTPALYQLTNGVVDSLPLHLPLTKTNVANAIEGWPFNGLSELIYSVPVLSVMKHVSVLVLGSPVNIVISPKKFCCAQHYNSKWLPKSIKQMWGIYE